MYLENTNIRVHLRFIRVPLCCFKFNDVEISNEGLVKICQSYRLALLQCHYETNCFASYYADALLPVVSPFKSPRKTTLAKNTDYLENVWIDAS